MLVFSICGVQLVANIVILGARQVVWILLSEFLGDPGVDLFFRHSDVLAFSVHSRELRVCELLLSACAPVLDALLRWWGSSTPSSVLRLWRWFCSVVTHVWIVVALIYAEFFK